LKEAKDLAFFFVIQEVFPPWFVLLKEAAEEFAKFLTGSFSPLLSLAKLSTVGGSLGGLPRVSMAH